VPMLMSACTLAPAGSLPDKLARAAAKKARKEARRAERKENLHASAEAAAHLGLSATALSISASTSVANRSLPDVPPNLALDAVTICLMYQYKEPAWTTKEHKMALNMVSSLAGTHSITGRGRCAPEGLNCTLTGNATNVREFCYALRAWDPLFHNTDFKLEDGVQASTRFRTFTLRKVDELVGYSLDGVKAPSLNRHAGTHLEAPDYHKQMQQDDTVIIDVRNAYESAIGHFQPPAGGAKLLDPQMRNSTDFPKWLNSPATKEQLQGKTVMMYCTGGIRCERATALLNQMTEAEDTGGFKTKEVVMVRGGIERYLKTFPEGGFWRGKNYLFDKRMEQAPENKSKEALQDDVESWCCICKTPHSEYRGQHKCAQKMTGGLVCAVPVIVCKKCQDMATENQEKLACPLCVKGYQTPSAVPDLLGQKRKLGIISGGKDLVTGKQFSSRIVFKQSSRRLFVGRLALKVTASALKNAFRSHGAEVAALQWIVDHDTGAFFGSVFLQMASLEDAKKIVALEARGGMIELAQGTRKWFRKSRRARVAYAPLRENETWSPEDHTETEYPPLGK